MGCKSSKDKSVTNDTSARKGSSNFERPITIQTNTQYENIFFQRLKKQFENDMETFILDQLVLSVMFFENFDQQIQQYYQINAVSEVEKSLNRSLFPDQKQIIMPDILFKHVNDSVKFYSKHGSKKCSEPLIPQRMYVTHENIEVLEPDDVDYNRIDKPNVAVLLEACNSKGYAKLKVDYTHDGTQKYKSSSRSSEASVSTQLEHNSENIIEEEETLDNYSQEEIYTYATINEVKTPHNIIAGKMSSLKLPSGWIKPIEVKKLLEDDELEDEINFDYKEDKKSVVKHEDIDLFITHYYCDSEVFMKHFTENVFPNTLGKLLQFNDESISNATYIPGTIFCEKHEKDDVAQKMEVYPSISISWPSKFTIEYNFRRRHAIADTRANKLYIWPTPSMVKAITSLKCVVTAKGFSPKRGKNPDSSLEWELNFPKAERFLLTRMNHAQVKAFLIIVAIFKTFIEPTTDKKGLLLEHIRVLLFWECENNFKDWNQRFLGTKILNILNTLCKYLGRGKLPDYFIKDKNVLENIPGKILHFTRAKFHAVQEHPVMHFISALRKLQYSYSNFYPELDYQQLYALITLNSGLKIVNPLAYKSVKNSEKPKVNKKKYLDKNQEWEFRRLEHNKKQREMKRQKEQGEQENESRDSNDSISLEFNEYNNFDILKKISIIQFFIQHFIKLVNYSLKLASSQQARFYLKQAEYLCKLLEDFPTSIEMYEQFMDTLNKLQETCDKKAVNETQDLPPDIPKRNSTIQYTEMIVNNKSFNIQNVTKNYNSGSPGPSSSMVNGVAKNVKMKKTSFKEDRKVKKTTSFRGDIDII